MMTVFKIKKHRLALWLVCLLMGGLFFTSCEKEEQTEGEDTVQLEVFGPSPALRGSDIRFIGNGMDKVKAVVLADGTEITDITVVNSGEIKITIPQEAPSGHLVLKYEGGEIRTKTPLTYSEPIVIDKIAPMQVKAGDILVIEGDYLNLIAQVIFAKDVAVDSVDFISQSRYKIEVSVPREAQTGLISVSNGAEVPILVYGEEEVGVVVPTVKSIAPNPVKPGKGLLITGTDFQLVQSILFSENITVAEFTVNESYTEIKVDVPHEAKEGLVKLLSYSGLEILSDELGLLAPEIESIAPNPVKSGAKLVITGGNLDLVTSVIFFGDAEGEIVAQSATKLEVSVPLSAKDGELVLSTHSGKTATATLTLVQPTVSSLNPTNLMAGNELTITGTHLDLVRQVIFGGGHVVDDIQATSATTLRVQVPMSAESGVITLVMANGAAVESSMSLTVTSPNIPIITKIPASAKPGDLIRIEGTKLHLVESVYFQDNVKGTQYGMRNESLIEVYIPQNAAKGKVKLKLITFDGKEVESPTFTISGVDPVVDPSYVFFDFDSKGSWWGTHGQVESASNLSISGNYFRVNKQLAGGWDDFFWRNGRDNFKTDGVTVAEWAIKMDVNVLGGTTQALKFRLNGADGDFWAIIPPLANEGGWYTVTIPLTEFRDDNGTGSGQLPNVQNIDQDFGMATNGAAGMLNIAIDNIRFEKIK